MNKITIREPIWETLSVGIDPLKMAEGLNEVRISYKKRDGKFLYPIPFYIEKRLLICYPVMEIKGRKLHIIPIKDLEFKKETMSML